ncbi:MAG: pyridoxamine 5'-phosphate oxidase family protein [Gammaproteobacteria bacterium]|nr:pyridoxamine 5'-phosphate oxidase family protein [Gammaproteobacteria bacterium]MBU1646380.1 pyridoxamine 5'-phosphate oxidase family protein [Gammaproteobacteria bacterium]MBU1970923.1 pyridoxamine 5'-phosphate oxidase family protein [Gammaproteobacteria bacterium]
MSLQKSLGRALLSFYKRRKQASSDLSLENCLDAARATASRTKYCFLVTSGEHGWPSARLVEPICDLDEFDVYIGTNPALRKIREISACANVTLAFGNPSEKANLIIYGTATFSVEPEIKRRYWKSTWRLFFSSGPNGNDYAVVKVRAERMELLSFRRNVIPEPFGLCPVLLQRTPQGWTMQAQQPLPADADLPRG